MDDGKTYFDAVCVFKAIFYIKNIGIESFI